MSLKPIPKHKSKTNSILDISGHSHTPLPPESMEWDVWSPFHAGDVLTALTGVHLEEERSSVIHSAARQNTKKKLSMCLTETSVKI